MGLLPLVKSYAGELKYYIGVREKHIKEIYMKKFLSLFLSYVLIFSSISPAFSQIGPVRPVGRAIQTGQSARLLTKTSTRTAEAMARMSQQLARGTSQLAVAAGQQPVPVVPYEITGKIPPQELLKTSWASRVSQSIPPLLSLNQTIQILLEPKQTAFSGLTFDQKKYLYLAGFPAAAVEGPLVLSAQQLKAAKEFYRELILITPAREMGENYFNNWAQIMAAVTNLGLFGDASDALTILEAAKKPYLSVLNDLTDIIVVRALLNVGGYKEIQTLADYRLGLVDPAVAPLPLPATWHDIASYMHQAGLPLTIPQDRIAPIIPKVSPVIEEWLTHYNSYNLIHTNSSAEVTRDWLELRKGIEEKAVSAAIQQELSGAAVPFIPTLSPRPATELKITGLQVSPSAFQVPDLTLPASTVAEVTRVTTAVPAPSAPTPVVQPTEEQASLAPVQPKIVTPPSRPSLWHRIAEGWRSFTSLFYTKAANTNAQNVLSKPYPMLTQLRDIVLSDAAIPYKRQALVQLYNRGVFKTFLDEQPQAVRDNIELLASDEERGRALLRLYEAKYLDPSLQSVSDVLEQGSLLTELDKIVTDESWGSKAERAYSTSEKLPFNGEDNFEGTVPTVPEADQEAIAKTFRPAGFAAQNSAPGVVKPKGIFYKNNIPFYYRYADGTLSSQPVGLLSQKSANWYGKFLSSIGMASKPGLSIPQGFVLALDEQGQWKYVMPRGNLSIVEGNNYSAKILKSLQKDGSYHVSLDTPYSTTDLLAMAHMLEHEPGLNMELTLNTPHSLDRFLTFHAFFVGNDAGNTLTGPFKESLKSMEGLANTMANGVSGIGYATPIMGGLMMPTMSRWGNVKTTKFIYGTAGAALAYSVLGLGMYGTVEPTTLPLGALAIPTVALVLGASLANSFIPTFLNFYKDPAARTAANLDFSTKKQMSRMGLSLLTTGAMALGGNWTIVAPVGLGLLGASYLLFRNTPMYKEAKEASRKGHKKEVQANQFSLTDWYAKFKDRRAKQQLQKQAEAPFVKEYQEFVRQMPEMQAIRNRVKMVYASYAASLMMMGQAANAAFPSLGQGYITACMAATLGTRLLATRLVKRNIMTDDQLTGISLPTLALTGAALTLAPYSGPLAVATGLAGILHYMATAVPGQLDAARMQNIVTAEMSRRKQEVLDNASLSEEQKEAQIQLLTDQEKVWSAQASKGYSYYNARGLWGIGAATAGAYLFADLGPQWTKDMLGWVSTVLDAPTTSLALNRLIFGYSTVVSGVLAWKNRSMLGDFFNFFRKQKVTADALEANKIHAANFGITKQNADVRLVDTNKEIKSLKTTLVDYGKYSEQRMTALLNRLIVVHNRLVAQAEVTNRQRVMQPFNELVQLAKIYEKILHKSDLSVMLQREFGNLQANLYDVSTGQLLETPSYVEEGSFGLPAQYDAYESASSLLRELDQLAYTLTRGNEEIDYKQFVDYLNRIQEDLLRYEKANPADSPRVAALRKQMANICEHLYEADQTNNLLAPKKKDTAAVRMQKQRLRDVLAGYKK